MKNTLCLFAAVLLAGCSGAPSRHASSDAPAPPGRGQRPAERWSASDITDRETPRRLRADIDRLASFGTRHTLSDRTSETRGIGAASRWILAQFEDAARARANAGLPPMHVSFERHTLAPDGRRIPREIEIVNVIAVIPGELEPASRAERVYLSGHYDSRNSDELDGVGDAPGANDDASGTALVIEACRILSRHRFDHTLVFVAFDAEEAGLYGARKHVESLAASGARVRAVLNNDIIGDPTSPQGRRTDDRIHLFSEGLPATPPGGADSLGGRGPGGALIERLRREGALADSGSRQLARYLADFAESHRTDVRPTIVFRADRFLRGGDHTPFHEAGFPAVRFTEIDEDYNRQHQNVRIENGVQFGDLPEFVDENYLAGVTRLNTAAAYALASAPAAPLARLITAQLTNDTTLRWSPVEDPDLAGYEVVWRETTSPDWQHAVWVGNVTEHTLPISKDSHLFGVRAYDRAGFGGLVGFAYAARE